MQTTSTLYRRILALEEHWFETAVVLGDSGDLVTERGERISFGGDTIVVARTNPESGFMENQLFSVRTTSQMFEKNPEVGKAIAAECDVKMLNPAGVIPRMGVIVPYVRVHGIDDGETLTSEWMQQGVFFIDTRQYSKNDSGLDVLEIHGFDAMLKAEQPFVSNNITGTSADTAMVAEIASIMGLSVDPRTWDIMTSNYQIPLPTNYTLREVLGFIASMYVGNFIITDIGELRLVSLLELPEETRYIIEENGDAITFGINSTPEERTASGSLVTVYGNGESIELTAGINPVQDLNGYSDPWVGGVGKNLLNTDRTVGTPDPTDGSNATSPRVMDTSHYYVGLRPDNYYYPSNIAEYSVSNGVVTVRGTNNAYGIGFPVKVSENTAYTLSGTASANPYIGIGYYDSSWNYLSYANKQASSYTFTTPQDCVYAVVVLGGTSTETATTWSKVQLEAGSSATTYEPYENICSVSGYTEISVAQTRKNLAKQLSQLADSMVDAYYVDVTAARGIISSIQLKAGQTYTLSFDILCDNEPFTISVGCGDGRYLKDVSNKGNLHSGRVSITFTPTDSQLASGNIFAFRAPRYGTRQNATYSISKIQLETGSTATSYEPYSGTTHTISWQSQAGTVYGGTITVNEDGSADLTATHMLFTRAVADMNNSSACPGWKNVTELENVSGVTLGTNGAIYGLVGNVGGRISYNTSNYTGGQNRVLFLTTGFYKMTQEEWKAAYPDLTVQFVLPLATPTTYHFTAQELSLFSGINNIWSNTGNVSIAYETLASEVTRILV